MNALKNSWPWMLTAGVFAFGVWWVEFHPGAILQPGQVWIYSIGGDDPFTDKLWYTNTIIAKSNGYVQYRHASPWGVRTNSDHARVFLYGSTRIE